MDGTLRLGTQTTGLGDPGHLAQSLEQLALLLAAQLSPHVEHDGTHGRLSSDNPGSRRP
jgi:hypothetical protein